MKLNMIEIAFIAFNLFTLSFALGQEKEQQNFQKEANEYFTETLNELGIPGFAVVVTQGDKTILSEGYGYSNFEKQLESDGNTNYYIASATKSFTALLAVILDAEGILSLEDPLLEHFPDLEIDSSLELNNVKLRDLLTHTSGISNEPIGWRVAFSGVHDLSTLIKLMKYSKPNKAGYGNYEYDNIGYNIYTIILEKVTGKKWQNWMQEKIFDPAGMNHTTAYMSRAVKENWSLAKPYIVLDSVNRIKLEKKDNTMQSAGGLITTPNDMAKWLKLQTEKGKLNGKQIFSERIIASSQEELVNTPESKRIFQPTHYGFGWLHGTYEDQKVIHHFGGFAGFSTHVSFIPNKHIGVSVMVNEAITGDKLMHLIATYVYDYFSRNINSTNYNESLNEFTEYINQGRKMISAGILQRNERPWLLSLPFDKYAGSYISEEYGLLNIEYNVPELNVSIGNLQCMSTPFTNEDSIRVELIPGSGQVIQFLLEKNKISGLNFNGSNFSKIK